jgi:hypothetical protein
MTYAAATARSHGSNSASGLDTDVQSKISFDQLKLVALFDGGVVLV